MVRVLSVVVHFFKNNMECDFENFIVVIECKNYLEQRLLCILLHILLSSLELCRRGHLTLY